MRTLGSANVTHCVRLSTPGGAGHPGDPCLASPRSTGDDEDGRLLIWSRRTTGGRACNPHQRRAGRDAAGHHRRPDLRKIAVTGVATPPRRPRPAETAPRSAPDRGRRRPGRGAHGARTEARTEGQTRELQYPQREPVQAAAPPSSGAGGRRPGPPCGLIACTRPGTLGDRALMSKRWSKGQYGAYDRPPQGDLPAAVRIQAESGQLPLAVLGVVGQYPPRGVS